MTVRKTEIALLVSAGILGLMFLVMVVPPFYPLGRVVFGDAWANYDECIARAFLTMFGKLSGCGPHGKEDCGDDQICISSDRMSAPCGKKEEGCVCIPSINCFATGCPEGEVCTTQPPPCTTPGCLEMNECDSPSGFCVCATAGFPICAGVETIEECEAKIREGCTVLVDNPIRTTEPPGNIAHVRSCAQLCSTCYAPGEAQEGEEPIDGCWGDDTKDMCEKLAEQCNMPLDSAAGEGSNNGKFAGYDGCSVFPLTKPPVEYEGEDKDQYPNIYG